MRPDRGHCLVCGQRYRIRRDGSVGLHKPGMRIRADVPPGPRCEGSLLPARERTNRSGDGYVQTFTIVHNQPWMTDGRYIRRVRGVRTYVENSPRNGLRGDTDVVYEVPSQQLNYADVDDWLYWASKATAMRGGP